jgi:hypothetical protein
MSLGPCNLWVMNVLKLKIWIPRRCLCFNTHTVYTVILVCLMLCTWPVSGSHKVNKVHTACRIAVALFFLHYFSAYKSEKCALVDYYTGSSGSFLPTFRDNLSFLPLCSGGVLLCLPAHWSDSFFHGVFLSSYTDHHTPLHPTTCNDPTGWHYWDFWPPTCLPI